MPLAPAPLRNLLDAWEQARRQRPSRRAATILTVIAGEPDADALPIGERDRKLFDVLEAHYGGQLAGVAECPACSAAIEIAADAKMLMVDAPAGPLAIDVGDGTLLVRLPNTTDIEAAAGDPDPARCLAERCVGQTRALTDDAVARINEAIFAADPLLDPELAVICPACGEEAAFAFDIAAYLWDRIEARALRTMRQVHLLARAYGWSEAEILALPEARRAAYLHMVEA